MTKEYFIVRGYIHEVELEERKGEEESCWQEIQEFEKKESEEASEKCTDYNIDPSKMYKWLIKKSELLDY